MKKELTITEKLSKNEKQITKLLSSGKPRKQVYHDLKILVDRNHALRKELLKD